jgi:hypothetical protein
MDKEQLALAARAVDVQASMNPDLEFPVDPDVADHMGAFEESAIGPEDLEEPGGDHG